MVTKNLHLGHDELDILAMTPDEQTLVIVEVRSTMLASRNPERTITKKKRAAMLRVGQKLLGSANKHHCSLRVDVVATQLASSHPIFTHYEGVLRL